MNFQLTFFVFISIVIHRFVKCENDVGGGLKSDNEKESFLWKPLLDVPNETFEKLFLPKYIDFEQDILRSNDSISAACGNKIRTTLVALSMRRTWAVKLFNSWAKFPPSGTLRGTLTDFGDYDQCLSADVISPQYCLVDVSIPMPQPMPKYHNYYQQSQVLPKSDQVISNKTEQMLANGSIYHDLAEVSSVFYYVYLQFGICLPDKCNNKDIDFIANKAVHQLGLSVNKFHCESAAQRWNINFVQLSAIALILTMSALTIASATYDRLVKNKPENWSKKILLWFSPVRNTKKLFCTKSFDDLTCIHGLRFFTIIWIIICHTLEWNNLNIFRDTFTIKEKLSAWDKQPIYKGHYSVETFFYLSGLLTSYVSLKYTNGDYRNFNCLSFVILRYLRLTPQLIVFLLLTSLLPPIFDGPLWLSFMSKLTDRCYSNWWHNLLYLQNLIDIENICAVHTWYLAADMQLHWMSLICVVLYLKNRSRGIAFTKIFILICICISGITIFIQRLPPGSVITSKNNFLDEDGKPSAYISFFYKPWNHVNIFFIGFMFGAFVYQTNLKQYTMQKRTKYLLWLVAFGGYLFCIYSTMPWLLGRPYDPIWSSILFPLNGTIWALVLTLVVWLCITDNGTIVGRLLSWSGFRPLSRMTYSVYLTHAWVLYIALGTRRELIDLNTRSILLLCSSVITASYIIGFVFTILFETPLIHVIEYVKHDLLENDLPTRAVVVVAAGDSVINRENSGNQMKLLAIKASNL